MAKAPLIQFSFNHGEVEPSLYNRSDWQFYGASAKKLKNVIAKTGGGVVKRPGTRYMCDALDQTYPSVFIPFTFSATQTYMLEFGNNCFRVFKDGEIVLFSQNRTLDGVSYKKGDEVIIQNTQVSYEYLKQIRFCQTGDKLYYTAPCCAPRVISRTDHDAWTIQNLFVDDATHPAPRNLAFGTKKNSITGNTVLIDGGYGRRYCVSAVYTDGQESLPTNAVQGATRPGGVWSGVTGTGQVYNTSTMNIVECYQAWVFGLRQTWPSEWVMSQSTGGKVEVEGTFSTANFLTGKKGTGTDGVSRTFYVSRIYVDDNKHIYVDYRVYKSYSSSTGKFSQWEDEEENDVSWVIKSMEDLAVKLVNAGAWGILAAARKKIDDYQNLLREQWTESNGRDGIATIKWAAPTGATYGVQSYNIYREFETTGATSGTAKKFYRIGSVNASTLTYTDNNATSPLSGNKGVIASAFTFGNSESWPHVCALFEQRLVFGCTQGRPNTFWGSKLNDFTNFQVSTPVAETDSYEFTLASSELNPINWIVPLTELLFGTSGSEWRCGGGSQALSPLNVNARAQSWYGCAPVWPVTVGKSIVFITRQKTNLRSFAYSLEADGYASKDLTAYIGHLFDGKTIEMIAHQQLRDDLVWAAMSDGSMLCCTYSPDEQVIAWTRHETQGMVETVGSIKTSGISDDLYMCVRRNINGTWKRYIEYLEAPIDYSTDVADMYFVDSGLQGDFLEAQTSVSGLDHLEGCTVVGIGDGNVIGEMTVENGKVDFPNGAKYKKITIGLPYEAEVETLEIEPQGGMPLRSRKRWIVNACLQFNRTRECFVKNSNGTTETEIKFRTESFDKPIEPFTGEKFVQLPAPLDARCTSIVVRSPNPVPFGLMGIIAEAGFGENA